MFVSGVAGYVDNLKEIEPLREKLFAERMLQGQLEEDFTHKQQLFDESHPK